MVDLRWGIKTAPMHTTYDAMREVWREAGANPTFEHAWLFDHFNPIQGDLDGPCFEGWTTLQALVDAGATHIILGLTYPYPAGIVARLADDVVAHVT